METVFFIGSHRTGTKALAGFFKDKFDNVISHHQYNSLRLVNIFSNMYADKLLSAGVFDLLNRVLIVKRITRQRCDFYIEANGFLYIALTTVKKYIDNVKIVHVIRDPRDFVSSYLNWIHGRMKSTIAHNMIPFWNPSGYLVGDMSKAEWNSMDEFEKCCWYWKYKNEKILELYADDIEHFITFRFEDLIQSDNNGVYIKELLQFMGLTYKTKCENYFNTKQNVSEKKYIAESIYWDTERCKQLHNLCWQLMKTYHYGEEIEWQNKIGV